MNVILKGRTKEIIETMVSKGYANTLSEAVRLAVFSFGEKHLNEAELVGRKLDRMDHDIREGKRRLLSADQALGEYSKYLK